MVAEAREFSSDSTSDCGSDFRRPLPPGSRHFEAYRLTAVEGLSTREAAAQMGVSQTRVIQLRDRVVDWISQELPRLDAQPPEQRLMIAEYLAVERMEFLYGASLRAWRQSQGPETVERQSRPAGDASTTIRTSHGNTRYLQQALRIAKEMGKFPVRTLPMTAAELEECEQSSETDAPLEEDCSALACFKLGQATTIDLAAGASPVTSGDCEEAIEGSEAADVLNWQENKTVQPADCVASLSSEAISSPVPRNRHERRARQRRLAKALKRRAK